MAGISRDRSDSCQRSAEQVYQTKTTNNEAEVPKVQYAL